MTLRAVGKLCWFALQLVVTIGDFIFKVGPGSSRSRRRARAAWLQRAATRHLKCFGCTISVEGSLPTRGFLVSNHLSYFDVMVIGSAISAIFVSKAEVRRWPLFGWLSALAGTIFIERERRTHVGEVNREIEAALADGALVVVFPEGTSSDGKTILPFRGSLLEPAVRGGHEISTAWLHYELDDGDARNDVCYWGDHSFFPHLLNLLGKRHIRATVRFGKFQRNTDDRKKLAKQLHAAVSELMAQD